MTWEEYENTDFYKESHPNWDYREPREVTIKNEMRDYINSVEEYEKRINDEIERQSEENDGEVDDCLRNGILPDDNDTEDKIVRYVTTKIYNGRVKGILKCGTYLQCLYARYEYNLACIGSEWDWAGIERIEAQNWDELDDIICGYRECAYDDYDYDYDY